MSAAIPSSDPKLENAIRERGVKLLDLMDASPQPGIFSQRGVFARVMDWSMQDPAFKTQLFRFVDVLPSLTSSAEIVRHLQEYLGEKAVGLNPALQAGLAASRFAPGLVAGPVKANVSAMAAQFVAGATPAELVKQFRRNAEKGFATTVDLLGESVVSEAEAEVFLQRNLDVLNTLAAAITEKPAPAFSDIGLSGPLPRLNLSVKVSALTPDVHPADPENSLPSLRARLRPILRRAAEVGALINFDMESYKLKDLTLALFRSILEEEEFKTQPAVGIAIQAYLRDSEIDLRHLVTWARQRGRSINVRLVKGAYWDYETVMAQQRGWPIPVWQHKAESDANYEKLARFLLENIDIVTPNFATHNVRSVAAAIAHAEQLGLDPRAYEFQALYGMADELKYALRESGFRVREYCAIGELLPGMAYLVRRLLENTSNEGFLRQKNRGEATRAELLANPVDLLARMPVTGKSHASLAPSQTPAAAPDFHNAPNTDFTQAPARAALKAALEAASQAAPRKVFARVGGKNLTSREFAASANPARPSQILGSWGRTTAADADAALANARKAQPDWARKSVSDRAAILSRAADLMENRRAALNAWLILEAGKPWVEADGDVSEAIDFCRYYAREMQRLDRFTLTQKIPGEACRLRWSPRGTGVVIAPWNFPLAILCGLTTAPIVGGNTVVLKPAEQTTLIAAAFMDILDEAGLPAGVVNFLPGDGEIVGAHLVAHPQVDFIAFTGSRAVGLQIWREASNVLPGQQNLKKIVCEMGGKNALIIDNDADLDEAIPAILASAFGFSGQKCSALSRLIVLDDIYEKLVPRLLAAAAALPVGDPAEPGTVVGPVIDAAAQKKILGLIEQGKKEGKLAWQGSAPGEGFFVPPTIFTDVRREHAIAREEIFGPVLAILRAADLDEAIALANDSDYALTGGMFSRSPSALERAERELHCGNLYLNRGITGAIVERHPFGGYKMSGSGTKAGGPGYLENFLYPRSIAENTLRRGFTPEQNG